MGNRIIRYAALFMTPLMVSSASAQSVLTWSGAGGDRWHTTAAHTNWTSDGGLTHEPWTQGADALFDGLPAQTPRVEGGGRQFNAIILTNTASGTLTIGKVSGNDADHLVAVGDAVIQVPAGATINLPQVQGSSALTLTGGGTLTFSRGRSWSGGTIILAGTFQAQPPGGTVTFLDTTGNANAMLNMRGVNSSWTIGNPILVRGGSTGMATLQNSTSTGSGFAPTVSGNIVITNTLLVRGDTRIGSASFTLSGDITGPGTLQLDFQGWGNNGTYVLSGDNTGHTGPLTILNGSRTGVAVQLNGTQGNMNITVPVNVTLDGTGALICNVSDGTADLVTLGSNAKLDLSGFTLQPAVTNSALGEYPIITPKTGVTGEFQQVVGIFEVEYDGTDTYPDAVVLRVLDNRLPVADPQHVITSQDTPVEITLTGSDPDDDPITFHIVDEPSHGTLDGLPPDLVYTPDEDYNGSDSFTFKVNDGKADSEPATVDITVTEPNIRPVAHPQLVVTDEDVPVPITLTGEDADDDPLTFHVLTLPDHGTLEGLAPDLTYTPDQDYYGSDSFTFKVNDGYLDSEPATVNITINPVNDPPVAHDQFAPVFKNTARTVTLTATDVEDDPLTYQVVAWPVHGTLDGDPPDLTYTPEADFMGHDSFTFKANDGEYDSNIATVSLFVSTRLTWSGVAGNRWNTTAAHTNWTGDGGLTHGAWIQGVDAVFDGLPAEAPQVEGGGRQFNAIILTNTASGTLTIGKVSGNDADHLVAVGDAVIQAPAGALISVPVVSGSGGLVKRGAGTLQTSRGWWYSGGTTIIQGTFRGIPGGGPVTFLDMGGSANAVLSIAGVNSSWTLSNPIIVRGGSTGMAQVENNTTTGGPFAPALTGMLTLTNTFRVKGDSRTAEFTLSGDMEGPGRLQLEFVGRNGASYVLTGNGSAHRGALELLNPGSRTGLTNRIDGIRGNMNMTVGPNITVTGSGALICNVSDGEADLVTLDNNAAIDLSGLTLIPNDPARIPGDYPIITPKSRVAGQFAAILGIFEVAYEGTDTYPDAVVLIVPPPPGTLFLMR